MAKPTVVVKRWTELFGSRQQKEATPQCVQREYLPDRPPKTFSKINQKVQKQSLAVEEVNCLRCEKPFPSSNRKTHRICNSCRRINKKETYYLEIKQFSDSLPQHEISQVFPAELEPSSLLKFDSV